MTGAFERPRTWMERVMHRMRGLPRGAGELNYSLALLSNLRSMGWQRSIKEGSPVDSDGAPLPWLPYPAINWLSAKVIATDRVFEFGAGHSTLWFARRVKEVIAVEHDEEWARRIQPGLPGNARVLLRPVRSEVDSPEATGYEYVRAIDEFGAAGFDVILIDGVLRGPCASGVLRYLRPSGIIVLDNSDRPENSTAVGALMEQGCSRIDLVGFIPGFGHLGCTSFFFRTAAPAMIPGSAPHFLGY